MAEMRAAVPGYIGCQPAAYHTPPEQLDFTALPEFPLALDPLQPTRAAMADYAVQAREWASTTSARAAARWRRMSRAMAKALGKLPTEERDWRSTSGKPMSAYEYYDHDA